MFGIFSLDGGVIGVMLCEAPRSFFVLGKDGQDALAVDNLVAILAEEVIGKLGRYGDGIWPRLSALRCLLDGARATKLF